ncbi:MAG: glycosyltransferase family 2 protein [Gemmatimonadota bacterium]|nr:glycosyltransferase family 2 protein [Gemmatimonadota bacterium]
MSSLTAPGRLSVVMPAYNEAEGIGVAIDAVCAQVLDLVPGSELVVVNDGSRDQTGALLDARAASDFRIRVVHKPNGGHGPAILTGLGVAAGEYFFLIDSDNQIPLEDFAVLWSSVQAGAPAAFGVRRVRNDAAVRRVLTVVIRASLRLLFGVRLHDANVPFKLLHRDLWQSARPFIPDGTLAPSLFLAVFAARTGAAVAFHPVGHRDRETGTVSIRRWKLLKFCATAFRQMLEFRRSLPRRAAT